MKYALHFLLLFLALTHSQAQQPCDKTIRGQVLSLETKKPLPYATIQVEGTSKGAISDENGNFVIDGVCNREIHLIISFVGYKSIDHHHDFYHPTPKFYLALAIEELESVVIEGKTSENIISSLAVQSKKVSSLNSLGSTAGDLVAGLTGVSTFKTGNNIVKPIIHGLHSNRVLIINNGVRHSYQAWGREHAPEIDPSAIDRLTVVKGASTVQYGPEALGGVIMYNPPPLKFDQPIAADIGTSFETNGRAYAGKLGLEHGAHRFAWRAGIYGVRQGHLSAPNYLLTNTSKIETGYNFSAMYHTPNVDLELFVNRFQQELGILRGSVTGSLGDLVVALNSAIPTPTAPFSYDISNPKQVASHDLYKLKASWYLNKHEITAQYAFQQNKRQEFDIRRGTLNQRPQINLILNTHSLDTDWKYPSDGPFEGQLGVQFFYQDNNNLPGTNTIPFIPNYNTTNVGVFTVQKLNTANAQYELGARYDYQYTSVRGRDRRNELYSNTLNFNNLTFSLGLIKDISKSIKFHTNIASAWRAPNIGELYIFGQHQSIFEYGIWRHEIFPEIDSISTRGVLDQTSKTVKSERGLKWIGTMEIAKDNFQAEVVPYVNFIKNFFFTRPYGIAPTQRGPFPYFIHEQTDALFYGADINASLQHQGNCSSELKAAYVHARDIRDNEYFLEIPPLNLSYTLEKRISNLTVGITGEWTSKQWNAPPIVPPQDFINQEVQIDRSRTFDFIPATNGFFLLHTTFSYEEGPFSALLRLDNMLNQSYRSYTDRLRYFADDLGFNASLALNYRLSK